MPQRNPKLIDLDFAPSKERRGPVAGGSSGAEEGATEIRDLMDQLQLTANEARHRLRAVEDERDLLAERVQMLQGQTDDLRQRPSDPHGLTQKLERLEAQRSELEKRLVEARQEVESLRQAPRPPAASGEVSENLLRETRRQNEDLLRQKGELSRTIEALNRSVQELNERSVIAQNQLVTLRQARDASQNQSRELAQKLEQLEGALADLQDRAEPAKVPAPAPVPDPAAEAWKAERPAWQAELELLRARVNAPPVPIPAALMGELDEVRAERDAALAEAAALSAQVERLKQSGDQGPSTEAHESVRRERDTALVQLQISTKEVMELREQLRRREVDLASQQESGRLVAAQAEEWRGQFTRLSEDREAAVRARDEMTTSLASAQKQIERIGKERDLLRESGTGATLALETKVQEAAVAVEEAQKERRELVARLEAQRLETIEVAARLQAAQAQVRTLAANLAEARLLAKAGQARPEAAVIAPGPVVPASLPAHAPEPRPVPLPPAGEPAPLSPSASSAPVAFPSAESYLIVRTMRRCYNSYAKAPDDLSHLNELHCAALSFAEQAREGGCVAVQRLGLSLAGLLQELYHFPEQITSEVLTTVVQSIEFLTALLKVRDLSHLRDPAAGTVCVIDDDNATRECVIMAMETVMVNTISYAEPGEALCGLASTPCDLIILDVQMPGMDGFELCSAIRQHSLHKHTPVVFVTGQTGPEARARGTLSGGNDFLTKPFILAELSLKALSMMVRNELHLAV